MNDNLGDILAAALAARDPKPTMIAVTLHNPGGRTDRKIADIRALREATRERAGMKRDELGNFPGNTMSIASAKAIIEALYLDGVVVLHMSPANYGCFMVNRHDLSDYGWQVKGSAYVVPEPKRPQIFKI